MSKPIRDELNLQKRPDRLGQYVRPALDKYLFANFSAEYLAKSPLGESFAEVPIPLRREDLAAFAGGKGVTPDVLAENMVFIMGCDPHFQFTPAYLHYLTAYFDESLTQALVQQAYDALKEEDEDSAFVHARAALLLTPDDLDAMYCYARVTEAMYQDCEDMEKVGRCKADNMEYLELITLEHPDFSAAYYHLGYSYLNLGLYGKAKLAWEKYLELADPETESRQRQEARERIESLKDPVAVESGINEAMAGRFEQAIAILEPFTKGNIAGWWPLHYYLGVSYEGMAASLSEAAAGKDEFERKRESDKADGFVMRALDAYKNVLRLNPSHLETLNNLAALYLAAGDEDSYYKYHRKAEIVARNLAEDEEEM